MELGALQRTHDAIREAGAQLFALCPELPVHARETVLDLGLEFPVLHDAGNAAARRYGIAFETPDDVREVESELGLDLPEHNGADDWSLPMPTRIVIDGAGVVRSCEVQFDHADRTDPAETLEVLRGLSARG